MTRRDAGIILWAAAGCYAVLSALSLLTTYGPVTWTLRGSVLGGGNPKIYQGIFDLGLICLTLSAIALLRHRAALSAWLFGEAPRLPAAAGAAADPDVHVSERVAALDLCVLVVVAVAIRLIVGGIGSLGRWAALSLLALTHPSAWLRSRTAAGLVPPIVLVAGVLLIARRTSVAAWVLRDGTAAVPRASRLDVQRTGLRLFGLMLIFGYLPDLLTEAAETYNRALWLPLLPPLLSMLIGVGLALGKDGLRSAWRRMRSQPPEEDQPEEDADSSEAGPPAAG